MRDNDGMRRFFPAGLQFLLAAWVLTLPDRSFATTARASDAPKASPNIIVFLVDDMGWMDCGVYGSQYYETPNIDRLATRGMLFTDAYTANPLCSPTRVSILTGKYPARLGFTTASGHRPPRSEDVSPYPEKTSPNQAWILPESRNNLPLEEITIAEALQAAGYRTGHFGKWHMGLEPRHWPDKQGFDVKFQGAPDPGPPSYHSPYGFKAGNVTDGPEGEYITDRVTDEALGFIEQNRKRPFLLHLWHYGVHGPWGHKAEITQTFAGKKDPRGQQSNPIMASMLKSIDESLGRVVAKLQELKLTENTIILFTSDNGGNVHSNKPGDRRSKVGKKHPQWAKVQDYRKWAGEQPPTNNAPLRLGKSWLYEGGVRVPLIVVWPKVVDPGSCCSTPVMSIDFYPTMLELASAARPPQQKPDGKSLVPLLKQTGGFEREALFNYFPHGGPTKPGGVTVRQGDWKLIRWYHTSREFPKRHELYNLRQDLGETQNLADEDPTKVEQLGTLLDRFLSEVVAFPPKPNPDYDPDASVLRGWVPKGCKIESLEDGLRVKTARPAGFLAVTSLARFAHQGPVEFHMCARTALGGEFRIQWRTAEQETFPPEGQIVTFRLPGSPDWQESQIELPGSSRLQHIRLYLPAQGAPVDLDQIELRGADGKPFGSWTFYD